MDAFEREEQDLEERMESGEMTLREYNYEMRELQRDYAIQAEEAAREAYDREMDRW